MKTNVKKVVVGLLLVGGLVSVAVNSNKVVSKAFYENKKEETQVVSSKEVMQELAVKDVISLTESKIGEEYVWGGKGNLITEETYDALVDTYGETFYPLGKDKYVGKQGFDCSGLINWAYNSVTGVSIGSNTSEQEEILKDYEVSVKENIQPGDLIFTKRHVCMYIGNNEVIHASNPKAYPEGGIRKSSANEYIAEGRVYRPLDYITAQQ